MPIAIPNGAPGAQGFWGNESCRFAAEAVGDKERAALQSELIMMGQPADLWLPALSTDSGVVQCTCVKETKDTADMRCFSCHGCKFAPGYWRFQYETLFWDVAEWESFTLTDVEVYTKVKAHKLQLVDGATTGTIETTDKPYSNLLYDVWTNNITGFRVEDTDEIDVEFSTDQGATWANLSTLAVGGVGTIRLRITLSRVSASTDSPQFQIARIRHGQSDRQNPDAVRARVNSVFGPLRVGQILVLRSPQDEKVYRQQILGRLIEWSADQGRTAPMDFFDVTIPRDDPLRARILDRNPGGHPILQNAYGINRGERTEIVNLKADDQLGTIVLQLWNDKYAQPGDASNLVW